MSCSRRSFAKVSGRVRVSRSTQIIGFMVKGLWLWTDLRGQGLGISKPTADVLTE